MITIIISGYGNLGRGMGKVISKNDDLELAVIFTRRDSSTVKTLGAPVVYVDTIVKWADTVDVCTNCGRSAADPEEQGPTVARLFNTVDSSDTHLKILTYFAAVDEAAKVAGHVSPISTSQNPGLFSMPRVLGDAVLPDGTSTAFWGPGVSQGRSDAIRRIGGVVDTHQYTFPIESAVHTVKNGEEVELTTRLMHTRACYVTIEEGVDLERIKREIVEMPNYFADYDTTVTFISAEELATGHPDPPHGGTVTRCGTASEGVHESIGFEPTPESNPEFIGSVLTTIAHAVARKVARGEFGVRTIFDVSLSELSAKALEELRAHRL